MNKTIKKIPYVTVMIAALNEEKNITKVIKECLKLKQYKLEILVVIDSKTTDNTKAVAEKAGAKVIHTGKWQGKGYALRQGQKYVKGDYVVQLDADYQFMPYDIPKLIKPLENGYDVALGSRHERNSKVEEGSVTAFRDFGNYLLSAAESIAAIQRVSDVLAGFKAFKTKVLKDINFTEVHYGYEAEEVILAAKKGYKIINIPIDYKKRVEGGSNVMPIKHGLMFLNTIVRTALK